MAIEDYDPTVIRDQQLELGDLVKQLAAAIGGGKPGDVEKHTAINMNSDDIKMQLSCATGSMANALSDMLLLLWLYQYWQKMLDDPDRWKPEVSQLAVSIKAKAYNDVLTHHLNSKLGEAVAMIFPREIENIQRSLGRPEMPPATLIVDNGGGSPKETVYH